MKKSIVAGFSAIALWAAFPASPASAADIYRRDVGPSMKDVVVAPVFSWTGFYIGGHGGGLWSSIDVENHFNDAYYGNYGLYNGYNNNPELNNNGFIAGGQFGYNWQSGVAVYGIEVDLGVMGLDKRREVLFPYQNGENGIAFHPHRFASDDAFYGDITGRLGYAFDRTLVYIKGGAAFVETNFDCNNHVWNSGNDDTQWGWTFGGGIETMVAPNWSLKLEYRHFEFDDVNVHLPNGTGYVNFEAEADTVAVGLNYHVVRGVDPLPLR